MSSHFQIARKDLRQTRVATTAAARLLPGQVRLHVDAFSLTSNNITYGAFGDAMHYWDFFPTTEGWGLVPLWGFGEVVASETDGVAVGSRVYGYFPSASHVVVKAGAVDETRFKATLQRRGNMVYGGPYRPYRDLEEIYRGVDFAWALDLEHVDHNSRWLLPCRFYEAGYFGVPCLAVHGFEVGSLVERHRIGWTFDAPLEDRLVRFFESITPADYDRIRGRLDSMPSAMFVADDDVARLSRILDR